MYFSYLLVYMEGIGLGPVDAGIVLIAGQIVDGFATPFVGLFSDNYNCCISDWSQCCWGYAGRRKSWYIFGLILVTTTFWILFTPFPTSSGSYSFGGILLTFSPVMYYAVANSLFQLGWASAQVTHMSMVPEITPSPHERCFLNSIRYAVTVGTSITVYILVCVLSSITNNNKNEESASSKTSSEETSTSTTTAPTDLLWQLQAISYIVLFVGALLGLGFIALVRENNASTDDSEDVSDCRHDHGDDEDCIAKCGGSSKNKNDTDNKPKTIYGWLVQTRGFYGVTATYAFSRLCVNIIQLYLPFYVLHAMPTSPSAVATVPLMAYVGMIISSIVAPRVSALPAFTDAIWLCTAATVILSIGASLLLLLGPDPQDRFGSLLGLLFVFVSSSIFGIGSAQLMITAQTQVGELVGNDSNGGVVFGIASLCDKLSTGVVIFLVQRLIQELSSSSSPASASDNTDNDNLGTIYRLTAAGGPLVCAVLACLSMLTVPTSIRDRKEPQRSSLEIRGNRFSLKT